MPQSINMGKYPVSYKINKQEQEGDGDQLTKQVIGGMEQCKQK